MTRILPSWKLLPAVAFLIAGCAGAPQSTGPGAPEAAAALKQLERSSASTISALKAIQMAREVSLHNLKNAHAMGFKRSTALLQEGGRIQVELDLAEGGVEATGNQMDVMISGPGFFQVKLMDSEGGLGYARVGQFFTNDKGEMTLNGVEGCRLDPPLTVPINATSVSIGSDGRVFVLVAGNTVPQAIGQIQLARFLNPGGLVELRGGIYLRTETSGPAMMSNPGEDGTGTLYQGALENSNVGVVEETIRLEQLDQWRAALLHALKLPG